MSDMQSLSNESNFKNYHPMQSFIFDFNNKTHYIKFLQENQLDTQIVRDADKICAHIFNLLGSGDRYLGQKIKWNEDFKSSFIWENDYYKNIPIVDLTNNSDVKVPWEISRFQHIFTLGKAYWITEDEKYALEFQEQIEDWIANNPYEYSVNWFCAMDVAIRAINWITGYYFFKDSSIDEEFWANFNNNLYLHGMFILNNLENKGGFTSNHYLSDVVGLIWLGLYFKDSGFRICENNNQDIWLEKGLKEFENEMFVQINEDGACYEDSTSYHRLDCELFLLTTILCNKNEYVFSEEYLSRLKKMFEFMVDIIKPNGLAPFIGDADDGRLMILSNYSNWVRKDFRHILAIAGEYFDCDYFRYYGKLYREDALWTMSILKDASISPVLVSKAYEKSGYYVLKNEKLYCIINAGELSFHGQGGHSHNDRLSIELNAGGEDFIIDPGVYVYTADAFMRNKYRSTEVHNTLYIKGFEQNDFTPELFELREQTYAECIGFCENTFHGRHYGYKDKCGVIHERYLKLENDQILIEDRILGEMFPNMKVCRNLTLHQDVYVKETDEGIELSKNGKIITVKYDCDVTARIITAYTSDSYGSIVNTKRIEFESRSNNKIMNLFIDINLC